MAFADRVDKDAKHCQFKCDSEQCGAESVAIRYKVVIGPLNDNYKRGGPEEILGSPYITY